MTDTPPLLPPDQMPRITDQASLESTWIALMGEPGYAFPQIWLLFLMDGYCGPLLAIDEVPLVPSERDVHAIGHILEHVMADDLTVAFLYARPGRGRTPGDLAWARGLASLHDSGWPVHLANDVELRVAAPDDLAQAG